MTQICGVDEAGRGPVIGPLVMAGVSVNSAGKKKLDLLGLKDSKLLSAKQREEFYEVLMNLDYIEYHISIAQPHEIDEVLNSPNFNLNSFEALHTAIILNKLKPDKAILDLPSNNAQVYNQYITRNLTYDCELQSEHKADAKYSMVSAASILAKVTRDRIIEDIKKEIGEDFGSGYPSDPKTVAFVKKHAKNLDYRKHFRTSWASFKRVIDAGKQQTLDF